MKFIGQFIQNLISRFKNDVYLEDISTGTIASGGNLGLDSNNKIVKAASTSHDSVTLAGTPDYITLSGQEITRNAIDLTADVTGVLPVANTAAKVTSIVAGDGIDVSGATGDVTVTAETATDSNPGVVELATTGESDTGTDTAKAVTPAGLKSHVDLRYAYAYMTWSASAISSMDGSDPEWVFPNAAKGIYEEDWTKDENIKATSTGSTTYTVSRQTAINALVIPHAGVCVGFHAHGRNNAADATFKTGLFHLEGSTTGTTNNGGIDYGATGVVNECTLRWIATADEAESSGGADATAGHNFKGPCKLVSNTDALTVSAGDALLPAIMGPDGSNEIFVTMTIILKIPLTT